MVLLGAGIMLMTVQTETEVQMCVCVCAFCQSNTNAIIACCAERVKFLLLQIVTLKCGNATKNSNPNIGQISVCVEDYRCKHATYIYLWAKHNMLIVIFVWKKEYL